MLAFRILHEDELLLAVDKPAGFHTHPPQDKSIRISPRWNGLAVLEKQIGQKLYPAHRLDRATSGVLLLSKERSLNSAIQRQFAERSVKKTYFCLVRGRLEGESELNTPLKNEMEEEEEAVTRVEAVHRFTLPIPGPSGADRVFTIVRATPVTGRYHQIRRHLARIGMPIVGDPRHGDRKLNREFSALTGMEKMFLRCMRVEASHPFTGEPFRVNAPWTKHWQPLFDRAGFCPWL